MGSSEVIPGHIVNTDFHIMDFKLDGYLSRVDKQKVVTQKQWFWEK